MSTEVDTRIVEMKFDNKDFEKKSQETLSLLDKLKEKLNFDDTKEKMNAFDTSKIQKELSKIGDFDSSKMETVFDKLEYRMSNMGIFTARIVENIADDIYNVVKKAMDGIGKVVTFAEQGIVQGGYNRAANIQSAKFQLEGLGIKWEEIYGDIDYAVTNTAYSLDQAAIVASQLASSGIKPGTTWKNAQGKVEDIDQMAMILRAISGTASATGGKAGYADIGRIFTKMISYGKVYTSQLNELGTYGIGAKGIVAEYLRAVGYKGKKDWTEQDVADVMSDRKGGGLDPYIVMEAFFNKFAEHATAANETLTGVTANLRAALARIGERFFEPIIANGGPLVKFLDNLRKSINDLNKAIGPTVESMGKMVAGWIDNFTNSDLFYENHINVETGEVERKFKLGGIFSDFLTPWKEGEWIKTNISNSDHIPTMLPTEYYQEYETKAQKILGNLRDTIKNIGDIISGIGKLFKAAFDGISDGGFSLASILVKITGLLSTVTGAIAKIIGKLNDAEFEHNGIYLFFRFLADSVRILISFGKSVATHLIKPIFNVGKAAAEASGVGSWFRDLLDKIHNFSENLKKEGNEDYFGPFLEKVKDFFKKIKDTITNGFHDIVEWWKPVKDIIFNSDLGFGEKISAIKAYFSENFELPGWSKVKDIFGGVADAVNKAWDAIKKFFGFGGKSNKQLADSASGLSDEYETVANKINVYDSGLINKNGGGIFDWISNDLFGGKEKVEKAEKSTSTLTKIGDGIANFFSTIKNAFSNLDVVGLEAIGYALLAILVAVAVGVVWVVVKVVNAAVKLTTILPRLVEGLINGITGVFTELSGLFKAEKFAAYAKGVKDLAIGVSILTLTFAVLAILVELIDKVGGDRYVENLKTAGIILGVITTVLAGFIISLIAVSSKVAVAAVALDFTNKKFAMSKPGDSMNGIANVLKALIAGILILTAAAVLMQYVDMFTLLEGIGKIVVVGAVLVGLTSLLMVLSAGLSKWAAAGTNGVALSGSMASIAAILTAIVVGLVVLTPLMLILSVIPFNTFLNGYAKLWMLAGLLVGVFGALVLIMSIGVRKGQLNAKTMSSTMLALAAMVTSIAIALPALVGAMWFLSKLSPTAFLQGFIGLTLLAGILVGIPALLLAIFGATEEGKNVKARNIAAVTLPILAIGAAIMAMSYGLRIIASQPLDKMIAAMIGIGGFLVAFIFILDEFKHMDIAQLKLAAITIGVIGGVVLALSLVIFIFSKLLKSHPDRLFTAVAIVFAELALLGAAVVMINKVVGNNTYYNALIFAQTMLALSLALIPMTLAMGTLMYAVEGVSWKSAVIAFGMVVAAMGVLAFLTNRLVGGQIISSTADINDLMLATITMAVSVGILGVVLTGMLTAIGSFGIGGGAILAAMVGFGVVMVAFGYMIKTMVGALSGVTDATKMVTPLLIALAGFIIPLGATALVLGALITVVANSGISTGKLAATAAIIVAMTLVPTALMILSSKFKGFDDGQIKVLATYVGAMVGVALALSMCGKAIAKIATIPVGQMTTATLCIGAMALAIAACIRIMSTIHTNRTVIGSVSMLVQFVGIGAGLYLVALVLKKVASINFEGMASKLLAMGAVAVVAVAIAALFGAVPAIGAGAVEAAALLLGVAGTLAGIGIFLVLSAEALDIFTTTILKLVDKQQQISDGLSSLLIGMLDGFNKFWEELNRQLPIIFTNLETTITLLLNHLHEVIKAVLIEIADFVNDPEVQTAVSSTITGLLDFLIGNASTWTSKLIQLGEQIIEGIIDGLTIALPKLGAWLDENIFNGLFSRTIDVFVEVEYKSALNDALGEWTEKLWAEAKKIFIQGYGYSEKDWDRLKGRYASEINGVVQYAIEAIALGNTDAQAYIEKNFGDVYAYFGNILSKYAKQMGLYSRTEQEVLADAGLNSLNDFIKTIDNPDVYSRVALATMHYQQALVAGWNTGEGGNLRLLAEKEIKDAIAACDNEDDRQRLYYLASLMGIQLPQATKDQLWYGDSPSVKDGVLYNYYAKAAKSAENGWNDTLAKSHFDTPELPNPVGFNPKDREISSLMGFGGEKQLLENAPYTASDGTKFWNLEQLIAYESRLGKQQGKTTQNIDPYATTPIPKPVYKTTSKVEYQEEDRDLIDFVYFAPNANKDFVPTGKVTDTGKQTDEMKTEWSRGAIAYLKQEGYMEKFVKASAKDKIAVINYLKSWNIDWMKFVNQAGYQNANDMLRKWVNESSTSDPVQQQKILQKLPDEVGDTMTVLNDGLSTGFTVLSNTLEDGYNKLNKNLPGLNILSKITLSSEMLQTNMDRFYFDPVTGHLVDKFGVMGDKELLAMEEALEKSGNPQVLGASRSVVESGLTTNYFDPLIQYMALNGGTTGNSYLDALILALSGTITARPVIQIEPIFGNDVQKEVQKAQASYYQAGTAAQSYYSQSSKTSLDRLRDKIYGYVKSALNFGEGASSQFKYSGEMVTAGLMYGMQDSTSVNTVTRTARSVSSLVVNQIKRAFRISSPAKELYYVGEMVDAGIGVGMSQKLGSAYLEDASVDVADTTEKSLDTAFSGLDLGAIAGKVGASLKSKLPSMSDIMSNFGLEKGLSGNLQGIKNAWSMLKDSFSDGIDFQGILKDAGFDISSITSGLGLGSVSLEELGFSISAGGDLGTMDLSNEFSTFDINDFAGNTDLDITLDLDTRMADDWLKQNTSIDMATSVPVTGGYERSTTGSTTYVNNYSFNQSNTSPLPISARDTARYSDLMLRRAGGWRKA